jgi:hypothetical protein
MKLPTLCGYLKITSSMHGKFISMGSGFIIAVHTGLQRLTLAINITSVIKTRTRLLFAG